MKKIIRIKNLDCAACAAELSEELAKIEGIQAATADFIGQRVSLEYEGEEALKRAIDIISHFEEVEIVDGNAPAKRESHAKEILSIALSALFFVPALVVQIVGVNFWIYFALFLAAALCTGWTVAVNAARNCVRAFQDGFHPSVLLDENLLMLIAAVGAFAIKEPMEGAAVMLLYEIGELLQDIAVGSSRGAIARLAALKSETALKVVGEGTEEVDPETLEAGDVILLRKGDRVPADCRLFGDTALDTKSLTGEAYLRESLAGEEVLAGCVNEGAAVKAEVVRPASESAVARILEMVENSSAKKAKPEKFITRFARIYTPVVVLLALLIAVIPPLFDGYRFALWVGRALNFLVISCPCALIISVPLTYFSGVGTLARAGVLAKGAVGLDALARVSVAAFDKTGTLTEGKFSIADVKGGTHVRDMAAALEKLSSHPLAQAFADCEAPAAENVVELAGLGLEGDVAGRHILAGSIRLMRERNIAAEAVESANLIVYVAENGALIGHVEIADNVRAEARASLEALKRAGVKQIAVLTGDTEARAKAALKGLPVDMVCSGLMPEEKPMRAQALRQQGTLMYVGDGINDTPVMAEADVAVAMGGLGSDAAIEASDFVLASDNLSALPKALKGAKKTRKIVFENIVFSIAVKVALMVLSLFGFIPLWAAVFGDVGVMLLAVLNSLRMRLALK